MAYIVLMSPQMNGQATMFGAPQAPAPKKSHAGGKKEMMVSPGIEALTNEIRDVSRRIRTQEERYGNLLTKTQITEQNILSRNRRVTIDIKAINSEINEITKEILEIKDRIMLLIRELQVTAKKEEVDVLKKYINLWEPVNFVTRNEIMEIIDEEFRKRDL